MSKGQLGIAILVSVGIIAAALLAIARHRPPALQAKLTAQVLPKRTVEAPPRKLGVPQAKSSSSGQFAARPSATIASSNDRRSGFAWILPQLGASETLLNRLADGALIPLLSELNDKAARGDVHSINILGFISYQRCYLGRSEEQISGYEDAQLASAKSLGAEDASWIGAVVKARDAYDRQFASACSQLINQDQVSTWVSSRAAQGDGASLWLLSRQASSLTESQQLLRDAAATGFPQAQFELAWAILGGQDGAAGTGPSAVSAVSLLRQAAEQLPVAEANLALCEYSGCEGIVPDVSEALAHARDAAMKGEIDALLEIAPHLSTSQIGPDEVAAWSLVRASIQEKGCAASDMNVQWMKSNSDALRATNISPSALRVAAQLWHDYGEEMMARLGCTS